MNLIINSDESLQRAIGEIREQYRSRRYITVTVTHGKKRSLSQNDISHAWYQQVANELREDTPLGVKSFCKLHFDIPILRAESDDFREKYDRAVKPMDYPDKLALMEWFPVTSLMTTPQLSEYLEKVQDHYRGRVALEFPDDERKAA